MHSSTIELLLTRFKSRIGWLAIGIFICLMEVPTNGNTLKIFSPGEATEGQGSVLGSVAIESILTTNLTVQLFSSDVSAVTVPQSTSISVGQTSSVFTITIVDDNKIDGSQTATITASAPGWGAVSNSIVILDNESLELVLTLPTNVAESEGVLMNAGQIQIAGTLQTNLSITLESGNTNKVIVPPTVDILAGQTSALFSVEVVDNSLTDGTEQVEVFARATSFLTSSTFITVADDDLHHFSFGPIGNLQYTNQPFNLVITARTIDGQRLNNYSGSIQLAGAGEAGAVLIQPTTISFTNGLWTGPVRVQTVDRLVRLNTVGVPGQSDPFHVEIFPHRMLSQQVADLVYHAGSDTVFGSVSNAGPYQNKLVAIDPMTATITNSYDIGSLPGQIEIDPTGQFLYVAVSNNFAVQRFDLTTRTAGPMRSFGTNANGPLQANDFAIVSGMPDSFVVCLANRSNYGITRRYDNGLPTTLPLNPQLYPTVLASAQSSSMVYGIDSNFRILGRFAANPFGGLVVTNGLITTPGRNFNFYNDVLYSESGEVVAASTFQLLGKYASSGAFVVDPTVRRTLFVDYPHFTNCRIKAFDRDSFEFINSILLPPVSGTPARMIRWGTNGIAFNTALGQVWFVQSSLLLPSQPPADLALSHLAPPSPVIAGSPVTYSLIVTNQGPGLATFVRISNAVPANVIVNSALMSTGVVTMTSNSLEWTIHELSAGGIATLQLSVIHTNAGWHHSVTKAVAYEADLNLTNNTAALATFVQFPTEIEGAVRLNFSVEDVIYDPERDRLLLSGQIPGTTLSNGITVLNPYDGSIDAFVPLPGKPAKLARSDDGQFLYVSLKDDALVSRLNLPELTGDMEFALGGESISGLWYPYYAADLAVVPGQPESLVVWRVRRAGPMAGEFGRGIALSIGGVLQPNITGSGGSYTIEFNGDTLFALNGQTLHRCTVNAQGIGFAQTFPSFTSNIGNDLESAGDRFVSSAGRALEVNPFGVTGIYSGSENALLVEPDVASDRVFYLSRTGTTATLKTYSLDTFSSLGSLTISNVIGTPKSLVRWGTNGIAFCTSSNQLFLVRGDLIQPAAIANLQVIQTTSSGVTPVGSNVTFQITVTNHGPHAATGLKLTNRFSGPVSIITNSASQGAWTASGSALIWDLGSLGTNSSANGSIIVQSSTPGLLVSTADLFSNTWDPVTGDNTGIAAATIGTQTGPNSVSRLPLPTTDLSYNPLTKRIYASVPSSAPNIGNGLLAIDPEDLRIDYALNLGAPPGRLVISDNAEKLYAEVESAIQVIEMPGVTSGIRFPIDRSGGATRVMDMDILPGSPESLVVLDDQFEGRVMIFDNGTPRPQIALAHPNIYQESLVVGDNPLRIYVQNFGVAGFRRYAVGPQGTTFLDADTTLNPLFQPMDFERGNGYLLTTLGTVIDPVARVKRATLPGIPAGSIVEYDETAGRFYYLTPSGSLNAFEATTLSPIGSMAITGMTGTPSSLTRWGTNGLAFRTTGHQVFIVRTTLIPSDPPADLSLTMTTSANYAVVGSNFVYHIAITNSGPNIATNAKVLIALPGNVSVSAVAPSQGTHSVANGILTATLGTLTNRATASVNVTVLPTGAGNLVVSAVAISDSIDEFRANNVASVTNVAIQQLAPDSVTILTQPVNDIIFDSQRNRLYSSGDGNNINVIIPDMAMVETHWELASQANKLALSSGAQFLYASIDFGRRIARIDPDTGLQNLEFSLKERQLDGPYVLRDMETVPSRPESLVVSKAAGSISSVEIYDDEMARPSATAELASPTSLEFGHDPNVLYGAGLRTFSVESNGIIALPYPNILNTSEDLEFDSGTIYTSAGNVVDPVNRVRLGNFSGLGTGTLVEPDVTTGRVFFLSRYGTAWRLMAYDPNTFGLVGSVDLANVAGTPRSLIRWGNDGLAFCTTSNQLFLLRTSLVPTGPAADLILTQSASNSVMLGSNITFKIDITNAGPATVTNALFLNRLPKNAAFVSATSTKGTCTQSEGTVTCHLGSLAVGTGASITIVVKPTLGGWLKNSASVTSSRFDPDLSNNTSTVNVGVQLPLLPDSAGILDLETSDIVYDAISGMIFASLIEQTGELANAVVAIDPATGLVGPPFPGGNGPTQLAVSHDGQYLYSLNDFGRSFRRLVLPGGLPDLDVSFESYSQFPERETYATSIRAVPDQSGAIAIVLNTAGVLGGNPVAFIYDDAERRPAGVACREIAFASNTILMGYEPMVVPNRSVRAALTSTGLVEDATASYLVDGEMTGSGGKIYTTQGSVIDPLTMTKVLAFPVTGLVAPDSETERVFFLSQHSGYSNLHAYDQNTYSYIGKVVLTNVSGIATRLIRCGTDRLAFRTSAGQVFIIRTSLVTTGPSTDPKIVHFDSNESGINVGFSSLAGKSYSLQVSDDLITWTSVSSTVGTGLTVHMSEPLIPSASRRFFRIREDLE